MRRRDFIKAIAGSAAVWPLTVRAQQGERMRRLGIIIGPTAEESETKARINVFVQELKRLGWAEGRNVRIEMRASAGNISAARKYAAELVAFAPDVILAVGGSTITPLLEATHTVPIVFTITADPVGNGFVDSMARPGGNVTGFMSFDYSLSGKWLELLKEIAPGVTRAAVLRDPAIPAGIGQFAVIQALAPPLGLDVSSISVRDPHEIERAVETFARLANGGLVVAASALTAVHRDLIVALADRHKLPAVYWDVTAVSNGGLIAYGTDLIDQHRQAASYVDRIFRGEKPVDLPVQAPNKYDLAINLKTAKALGLIVSPALLARANKIIERSQCPLLAQSGHFAAEFQCPLLGVKRTSNGRASMSAYDPKRTSAHVTCCDAVP
jgi:putative tryptophan/tyrosine transport system substrate-binding protein